MTEPLDSVERRPGGPPDATDDADAAVLRRVAGGDLGALEALYARYKSVAYAIALRITADPGLAEDVVQDAFLGAWRNAGRYAEGRGSVRTWLLSIVHHRGIDALRRRRATAALPDGDEPPPPSMTLPDVWPEVAGRLDGEAVRAALGRLSGSQREALELAYWSGLTQQEIAAKTGTPLGTVKSRMRLGLLALRSDLLGLRDADGGGDGGTRVPVERATVEQEGPGRRPAGDARARLEWLRVLIDSVTAGRHRAMLPIGVPALPASEARGVPG